MLEKWKIYDSARTMVNKFNALVEAVDKQLSVYIDREKANERIDKMLDEKAKLYKYSEENIESKLTSKPIGKAIQTPEDVEDIIKKGVT